MDWEANLAAIIKCTDANLEQQFRQFEDVTAEFTAAPHTSASDPNDNVATSYFRETIAAESRHRQQQEREREHVPTPSYSRVSSAFARGATTSAPTTSFSEHFHRRQERKRGVGTKDNQRRHRGGQEYAPMDAEEQVPDQDVDERRYAAARPTAYQMYNSPTYDMAQMMEQVRLSLKLEVDARAAIAERQLSALLQLCKATSEELDRLRVEVCAADRQLHTLDQVQSKIRQELTTQKDIGFHLQSMCGKDESWRMQTENQLLELRQMVAALREQGNSTQVVAQEKLSRSELLVQFNAAMEPIKAQLQANLQHQAQQIADITRTTSSSSLLLDGLTQKVNRSMTDEMNELRSDLNALKHHVAKMDIFQVPRGAHNENNQNDRSPTPSQDEIEAKAKEDQQRQEKRLSELREGLLKDLTVVAKDCVNVHTRPIRQAIDESESKFAGKKEIETLHRVLEEGCRSHCGAMAMQLEKQINSSQEKGRSECTAAVRDAFDRMERLVQQGTSAMTAALEGHSNSWQGKLHDLVRNTEKEQKERKLGLDELHEALRKSRHQLEDQIHTLTQESRTKLSQHGNDLERRMKEVENHAEKSVEVLKGSVKAQSDCIGSIGGEWEQKLKRLEDTLSSTNLVVAELSKTMAAASSSAPSSAKEASLAIEKQTSVYVSTMESLLQKMQLQLQLQAQSQAQVVMAQSPYHGFWPPSPYAPSHPPPPTLHLPPSVAHSSAAGHSSSMPLTVAECKIPTTSTKLKDPLATNQEEHAVDENKGGSIGEDKSAELVRGALPVQSPTQSNPAQTSQSAPLSLSHPSPSNSTYTLSTKTSLQSASNFQRDLGTDVGDQSSKREYTIVATAKGALAEAELAKARVENRRKQEMEIKQQQQKPILGLVLQTKEHVVPPQPTPNAGNVSPASAKLNSVMPDREMIAKTNFPPPAPIDPGVSERELWVSSTPSLPTQLSSSTAKDTNSPPLSPLAKIFARCTTDTADEGLWSNEIDQKNVTTGDNASSTESSPRTPAVLEVHNSNCSNSSNTSSSNDGNIVSCEHKILQEETGATEVNSSFKKCRHCSAEVPSLELLEHEISCDKVLKQCPHCLRRQKMSELQDHIENCDCRLVSCPNDCGGKFLQRGIPNHLATRCPKKPVTSAPNPPKVPHPEVNKPSPPSAAQLASAALSPTEKAECKFCDDEIESSKIDTHEQNCDWRPKRCQHCNMVVISRDLVRHETSCKINLKPCPHCSENMPQSALATHASRCSKRPIKCIRCCQLFSADSIVAHSTNCKSVPVPATTSLQPQSRASVGLQQLSSRAPIKIPPPPPFPPLQSSGTPTSASQLNTRRASADPRMVVTSTEGMTKTTATTEENTSDRMTRRNLALSQLTNPGASTMSGSILLNHRDSATRASAPSLHIPTSTKLGTRSDLLNDEHDEEDEDEDYEDEDEEDEEDDQLTLAQVVKEWSVENVCLWLHEDVGIPEVVTRFQQKHCNGEMLLELTEGDLINDFGINDRVHREKILNAIEAIQTSDEFSDDDGEEEDDDEDDVDEEGQDDLEESDGAGESPTIRPRHSIGEASFTHPRDILRRKSQPSPQSVLRNTLPSSNDMLRRISNALEDPNR